MRVYRPSDRIKIKVDELEFTIKPLSYHEKVEIQQEAVKGAKDFAAGMQAGYLALKYAITGVSGLENPDGSDFDYNGSEDDIDAIMNLGPVSDKLTTACLNLIQGIPKEFVDLQGKPLKGVKFVGESSAKKK